jgi:spermidine/putrescine transport system permease protein
MVFGRARHGVAFGTSFTFLLCLFASAEPQFLDGPTRSSMRTIASSLANVGVSALMALGALILLIALVVTLLFVLAWMGHRRAVGATRPHAEAIPVPIPPSFLARRRSDARMSDLAIAVLPPICTAVALLLTLCPIAAISLEAFRQPTSDGDVWTLANFGMLLHSNDLLAALGRSATLAVSVSIVATAVGFALGLVSWAPARAQRILFAMLIMTLIPGEVFSLGLLQVARLAGYDEGAPLLAGLAHIVWIAPFTTITLMLANLSIDRSVIEAALELGRTPTRIAIDLVSRINWSAIAASAIFAFTLSLNENTRVSYLGGSEPALANEVFGRLQAGLLPDERGIFAIEFLLVVAALLSSLLILYVLFRASQKALG